MDIQLRELTAVSNNSQLTNIVLTSLNAKLDDKEKADFRRWLKLIESETHVQVHQASNKFRF